MSQLRHKFRIVVDGVEHEIRTSARDMAALNLNEFKEDEADMMFAFQLVHAACMRLRIEGVPADIDEFVDVLDDFDDLEPDVAVQPSADPTPAPASAT